MMCQGMLHWALAIEYLAFVWNEAMHPVYVLFPGLF